ncbi:MAG: 4-hydroxy-3-methylbut-2-enyl diphosphate reductase [Peptostreptococcaceae bacterium]
MEIKLAKKAGFCFGVKRAMQMAFDEVEKEEDIFALGPLIHNKQAINRFEEKGLITLDDISEIKNNNKVIIRSHGVSKEVYSELKEKNSQIIDTTCPFVTKIHKIVEEKSKNDEVVIIIGDEIHPEIIGINGWCDNLAIIIKDVLEIEKINFDKSQTYCVVSQTTLNKKLYDDIKNELEKLNLKISFNNTICSATNVRQDSAKELSNEVDLMIIIGGRHSSNTQKLYQICTEKVDSICIETKEELIDFDLSKYKTVGITAGASTPDWVIDDVIYFLESK